MMACRAWNQSLNQAYTISLYDKQNDLFNGKSSNRWLCVPLAISPSRAPTKICFGIIQGIFIQDQTIEHYMTDMGLVQGDNRQDLSVVVRLYTVL